MYWPEVGCVENDSPFIGKCVSRPGIVDRQLDRFGREPAERDVVESRERAGVDRQRRGVQHQAVDVHAGHDEQVFPRRRRSTGSAPSVTLVISCPPTMSGWPFNSSRAPGASVSEPVVVNGADSVMRPCDHEVRRTRRAAVLPLPVSTVWPGADDGVAGVGVVGHREREAVGVERGAGLEEQIANGDVCGQPRNHGGRRGEIDARGRRRNAARAPVRRVVPVGVQRRSTRRRSRRARPD